MVQCMAGSWTGFLTNGAERAAGCAERRYEEGMESLRVYVFVQFGSYSYLFLAAQKLIGY